MNRKVLAALGAAVVLMAGSPAPASASDSAFGGKACAVKGDKKRVVKSDRKIVYKCKRVKKRGTKLLRWKKVRVVRQEKTIGGPTPSTPAPTAPTAPKPAAVVLTGRGKVSCPSDYSPVSWEFVPFAEPVKALATPPRAEGQTGATGRWNRVVEYNPRALIHWDAWMSNGAFPFTFDVNDISNTALTGYGVQLWNKVEYLNVNTRNPLSSSDYAAAPPWPTYVPKEVDNGFGVYVLIRRSRWDFWRDVWGIERWGVVTNEPIGFQPDPYSEIAVTCQLR